MPPKVSQERHSWADMSEDILSADIPVNNMGCFVKTVHEEAEQITAEVPQVVGSPEVTADDQDDETAETAQEDHAKGQATRVLRIAERVLQTRSQTSQTGSRPSPAVMLTMKSIETMLPIFQNLPDPGPVATMWIFPHHALIIHVEAWLGPGRLVSTKGKKTHLWLAKVVPHERGDALCIECQQPSRDHEEACAYHGQVPCNWCNRFPCRHPGLCSHINFACRFCHWSETGHCLANQTDVRRYFLDSWWPFQ
eukprot:Skav208471  [mRNA]  locus=scaffold1104:315649:316404:+ [translate_table: standard]